jgi:hypothetical protein
MLYSIPIFRLSIIDIDSVRTKKPISIAANVFVPLLDSEVLVCNENKYKLSIITAHLNSD